jgi:hypothetical protein
MCAHVGILCPTRLCKKEVFDSLINALLFRGGSGDPVHPNAQNNKLFGESTQIESTTKSIQTTTTSNTQTQQDHIAYFDFENAIRSTCKFIDESNAYQIVNLLNMINIPGYIVYFNARKMLENYTNIVIESFPFSDNSMAYKLSDNETVYQAYIITHCMFIYVNKNKLGIQINEIDALNVVLEECSTSRNIPTLLKSIFTDDNIVNAKSALKFLANTIKTRAYWWNDGEVSQLHGGTPAPDSKPMVNFLVQNRDESFCGYISLLTMLSKSDSLCHFIQYTLSKRKLYFERVYQSLLNPRYDMSWRIVHNAIVREIINVSFILHGFETVDFTTSLFMGVNYNYKFADIKLYNDKLSLYLTTYKSDKVNLLDKKVDLNNDMIETIEALKTLYLEMIKRHDELTKEFEQLFGYSKDPKPHAHYFSTHYFLNEMTRLFPNYLEWYPFGAAPISLYQYIICLFIAIGVNTTDIAYAYSNAKKKYHLAMPEKPSIEQAEPMLYIHFLNDKVPFSDPLNMSGNTELKDFDINENLFENLSGCIMATTPNEKFVSSHYISGFVNDRTKYLHDNSMLDTLRTPHIINNWEDFLLTKTFVVHQAGIFLTDGPDSEEPKGIFPRFEFPGGDFVGFGVLNNNRTPNTARPQSPEFDANILSHPNLMNVKKIYQYLKKTERRLVFDSTSKYYSITEPIINMQTGLGLLVTSVVTNMFTAAVIYAINWRGDKKSCYTAIKKAIRKIFDDPKTIVDPETIVDPKIIYRYIVLYICGTGLIQCINHTPYPRLKKGLVYSPALAESAMRKYSITTVCKTTLHKLLHLLACVDTYMWYIYTKSKKGLDEKEVNTWFEDSLAEYGFIKEQSHEKYILNIHQYIDPLRAVLLPYDEEDDIEIDDWLAL